MAENKAANSSASSADCLFCKIVAGSIPSKTAFQNDELIAFHDINPAAPTHILIVPRQHILNTTELTESNAPLIGRLILAAAKIAHEQGLDSKGYRIVTNTGPDGGQSVSHLHLHLLGGRKMSWPPG